MLGVGGGGYGLTIAQNKDVSVGDIASDPGREINISVGGFVVDASLNVLAIPSVQYDEKDNSYAGFMTSVQIGYAYGFPSSDWTFSGGDVNDGPNFGINMLYIKLVIGGLGYSK